MVNLLKSEHFLFPEFQTVTELNQEEHLLSDISKTHQAHGKTGKLPLTFKDFVKTAGIIGTISTLDAKLTPIIARIATQKWGFSLGHFIPNTGRKILSSLANPIARLHNRLGSLLNFNKVAQDTLIAPVCEEIEFRWFIQNILLRQLPKKLLSQISPAHASLVDSNIAKISRTAVTALLFASLHTHCLDSEEGGLPQLTGGILYGLLYEYSNISLINCINLHCLYNYLTMV